MKKQRTKNIAQEVSTAAPAAFDNLSLHNLSPLGKI